MYGMGGQDGLRDLALFGEGDDELTAF